MGDCVPHTPLPYEFSDAPSLRDPGGAPLSCKQCPPGSSSVVGPLYAPIFGFLATAALKLNVDIVVDNIGVTRMAPTAGLEVPAGHVRLPSARPAAGKTYTAKHEYHCALERQIGQSKFYIIIVPFQVNEAGASFIFLTLTRPPIKRRNSPFSRCSPPTTWPR